MLPLLQCAADGKEKKFSEAIDFIAGQFKLTPEERAELLPSGNRSRFAITALRFDFSRGLVIVFP